jgi:hypothetical protein
MTRNAPLEVHVEELVLVGFPAGGHDAIAEAVQAELQRRLAAGADPGALAALAGPPIERIDAGVIHVRDPRRAVAVGTQVGGLLASALVPGGER